MKKFFTLLAATTLFAGVAFAQDAAVAIVDSVSFNVPDQQPFVEDGEVVPNCFILPSVNETVTVQLFGYNSEVAQAGGWQPYFVWTKGTGYAIDQDMEEPTPIVGLANAYGFTFNKEKWGNPSGGYFFATLMLCFVNADFDFYADAEGEPIFFDVTYRTVNTFPAEFLYAYPDGAWEDGDSFTKAYKANGEGCRFNFNNTVDFADNDDMGEIVYTLKNGTKRYFGISLLGENEIQVGDTIPTGKATVGFNPLDGNYVVAVQYWTNTLSVDQISSVEITLWDMTSKGVAIPDEEASITNNAAEPTVQKIKKSRLVEGLGETDTTVDVYNLQGMLVKSNISKTTIQDLPAGLYIVNGKKVIIR